MTLDRGTHPRPSHPPQPPRPTRDLEVFAFPQTGQEIRTVLRDGEPWFVAADVCSVLSVGNPSDAVRSLDDDEYELVPAALATGEGRPQDFLNLVTESGLYSLILRSRKPEAKTFKRWVTHEVLPAIRRTGRYDIEPAYQLPQSFAQALRLAADQYERAEQLETKLSIAAPKAIAWDVLASTAADYSVREAAHILNRDPGIDTGQGRLFAALRALEVIDKRNRPYASHSKHVRLRPTYYTHPRTGEEIAAQPQVRITVEGLKYLHKRLGGADPFTHLAPAMEASA